MGAKLTVLSLKTDSDETSDSGLLQVSDFSIKISFQANSDPFPSLLNNTQDVEMATWKSGKNTLLQCGWTRLRRSRRRFQKIGVMMRELQSLHNKRLTVSFDINEDDQEREINQKTLEITGSLSKAESYPRNSAARG